MLRHLLLATIILAFASAAFCAEPESHVPRQVTVGIYVVDILEIDSARQTLFIDLVVRAAWTDESLAAETGGIRFLNNDDCWTPRLQIVGDLGMRRISGDLLEVRPDGTVEERVRYVGLMSSRMNLSDFPLDRQAIRIEVVSAALPPAAIKFDQSHTGKADTLTVADWQIGDGQATNAMYRIMEREFPSAVFEIPVSRHFGFYLWKVIVPLALIVFMSWAVFWIDPGAFGPQIGAATASMLTLIAYRFALGNLVPKISYFTRMDIFITGATMLVFLALLQALMTGRLASRGSTKLAQRFDDVCRWVFPAGFVCLVAYSFLI